MSVIIATHTKEGRDELLALCEEEGYFAKAVEGLDKMLLVGVELNPGFTLQFHPAVKSVSAGDMPIKPCSSRVWPHRQPKQVTSVEQQTPFGGWGPPRVIRRDSPWRVPPRDSSAGYVSTFYSRRQGLGVDICMIDSGAEVVHPEFQSRAVSVWYSASSYAANKEWDASGHGTHCFTNAAGGTAGIARKARILVFKFFDSNSGAGEANAVSAMGAIRQYHVDKREDRPTVMFFSWSGFSSSIAVAVGELIDAGVVCCFPAGNDSTDLDTVVIFPAEADPDAVICGGSSFSDNAYRTNENASGTNWGAPVDILAPAQRVAGARRVVDGGGWRVGNGTSFATPFVAGVVACMLEGYSKPTTRAQVQAIKAKLIANATRGRYRATPLDLASGPFNMVLPDRLLYLDPEIEFEHIPGLIPNYL